MVKHTQIIRRQQPKNFLNVFDHFVGLALKGSISVTLPGSLSLCLATTATSKNEKSEPYLELNRVSKIEFFAKIVPS